MRRAMEQMKISVEQEVQKNEKCFTDLIHCIEEVRKNLVGRIREHENQQIEKAEGVIEQIEMEMEELKKRDAELKELSKMNNDIYFLQNFKSLCVPPTDGDSLHFDNNANLFSEDLRKELSGLKKSLEKVSQWDVVALTPSGHEAPVLILQSPDPRNRDEILKYFFPLTLDIDTAHRELRLSGGNKKVTRKKSKLKYPEHPDRFDLWAQVLCREALTETRCYWELQCTGRWMDIGVAYKGLGRKGKGDECRLGNNDKSWSLRWSNSQYSAHHNNMSTDIRAPHSLKLGVYLDWSAGILSFYSASPTLTLLHTFSTSFTEPLYPGFGIHYGSNITILPSDTM
ncbi:tripartite motif-containing protein 16-like [Erpetoichthys calabaricus]|uniref:tripartite motif-containing protein 16-like n=1 Tax=Erpetoichthys calabaricus TaxID=27687 RepID=UPI002234415B|nr:tripartite motif-containing protein 16-like [Erpetoichthys calabaricus]